MGSTGFRGAAMATNPCTSHVLGSVSEAPAGKGQDGSQEQGGWGVPGLLREAEHKEGESGGWTPVDPRRESEGTDGPCRKSAAPGPAPVLGPLPRRAAPQACRLLEASPPPGPAASPSDPRGRPSSLPSGQAGRPRARPSTAAANKALPPPLAGPAAAAPDGAGDSGQTPPRPHGGMRSGPTWGSLSSSWGPRQPPGGSRTSWRQWPAP